MRKRLLQISTTTPAVLLLKERLVTAVSLPPLLVASRYFLIFLDPNSYTLQQIERQVEYCQSFS